jgi:ABC-2 type transport system ATP-binding protein
VAEGTLGEVLGEQETRIRVEGLAPAGLASLATFGPARVDGDDLLVPGLAAERVPDLVAALVGMGVRVHAVTSGRESLEARFLELIARNREADGAAGPERRSTAA